MLFEYQLKIAQSNIACKHVRNCMILDTFPNFTEEVLTSAVDF